MSEGYTVHCQYGIATVRMIATLGVVSIGHRELSPPLSEEHQSVPQARRSIPTRQRARYDICGSTIWQVTPHNAGAMPFDDAANCIPHTEFSADRRLKGCASARSHNRLTTDGTIALFALR